MRNPAFNKLLDEIRAIHDGKSHDYAGVDPLSNLRMCEAFGVPAFNGVLVRLSDKWSRITQIAGGKQPKHESLRDSLIDNAVYSLLAIILLDEQGERRAEKDSVAQNLEAARTGAHSVGQLGYVIPEAEKIGATK